VAYDLEGLAAAARQINRKALFGERNLATSFKIGTAI
jgi:hypothetical protein